MTLVGDFGQASRPGAAANWDDVISNLPVRVPPHRVTLTVNYRTPAEIMDVANRLLPGRRAGRGAGPPGPQHRRAPRGRAPSGAPSWWRRRPTRRAGRRPWAAPSR